MHCKKVKALDAKRFWRNFENDDRALIYNPNSKELIIGAKKSTTRNKYMFCFMPFSKNSMNEEWSGLATNGVSFEYYLKVTKGDTLLYYNKEYTFNEKKEEKYDNVYEFKMPDFEEWKKVFGKVKHEINNGKIKKVVLSQRLEFEGSRSIDSWAILDKLMEDNPQSYTFAHQKGNKIFLGSTPEILVEKRGNKILSYALAGTVSKDEMDGDKRGNWLLNDAKNKYEHRLVVDKIVNIIGDVANNIEIGDMELLELKKLYHLKTSIKAENSSLGIMDWVKLLHPTPAMGGEPRKDAVELIKKCEKHDRGLFAAPLGIVDEQGDGIFVVGIRSALIQEKRGFAYAGCGIVERSECRAEYDEINNKLQTILEAL